MIKQEMKDSMDKFFFILKLADNIKQRVVSWVLRVSERVGEWKGEIMFEIMSTIINTTRG